MSIHGHASAMLAKSILPCSPLLFFGIFKVHFYVFFSIFRDRNDQLNLIRNY